ncbi:Na+/H+ antiporter subunit E [Pseudohaliea rubra]|uniref:Cation antiporter n=1 Tax=Pseudohaliea rubra DSM 19751 TaxID=1265313 RepID=A0A095WY38_9GAMM|nr:Na+/H+ antiporter subunit E [Pseudohaliea rubra]KGE03544.1 Cation antiporter precursor [Pseudohaliea rubra DSM 19751]
MRALGLFLVFALVWLLLSGLMKPLVLGLGVVSCLLCVWLASRMHRVEEDAGPALRPLHLLAYLPWLLKEVVLANLQVMRVVLSPRMALDPVLFRLRATQRSQLCKVIYGNSITLTPGTLTLDVDGETMLVHALERAGAEALRSGEMDRRASALEASA